MPRVKLYHWPSPQSSHSHSGHQGDLPTTQGVIGLAAISVCWQHLVDLCVWEAGLSKASQRPKAVAWADRVALQAIGSRGTQGIKGSHAG